MFDFYIFSDSLYGTACISAPTTSQALRQYVETHSLRPNVKVYVAPADHVTVVETLTVFSPVYQ